VEEGEGEDKVEEGIACAVDGLPSTAAGRDEGAGLSRSGSRDMDEDEAMPCDDDAVIEPAVAAFNDPQKLDVLEMGLGRFMVGSLSQRAIWWACGG